MDTRIRNYLGIALIIGILVVAYAAFNFSYSYSRSIDPFTSPTITVAGEGRATAIPDIAKFNFGVITEGASIPRLQEENAKKVNQIIDYLKSAGIPEKDIATKSYNLEPRYQSVSCPPILRTGRIPNGTNGKICPPPRIVGYSLSQTVEVKIRNFEKIGEILGGVTERGANTVSQLSFTVDDPVKAQNEARAKAISQAREKAQSVAQVANIRLGRLLTVSEFTPVVGFERLAKGGFGGETPLPSPVIEPGSQEVTITVNLVYEIK